MTLGKGYIVLIAGVAMIVSGIAISALGTGSMLGSFLKENTVVAQTLIKPSESVNATLQVNDIARTVSLAIHTNSKALNATLNELVRYSHGSIVSIIAFNVKY